MPEGTPNSNANRQLTQRQENLPKASLKPCAEVGLLIFFLNSFSRCGEWKLRDFGPFEDLQLEGD